MPFFKWFSVYLCIVVALASCNVDQPGRTATPIAAPATKLATLQTPRLEEIRQATPVGALATRLPTPQPALLEEPLQGRLADIPEVWIATSRQSKRALVNYLYAPQSPEAADKLLEQLEWVNPNLTDPILPDTLVAIPPVYRVSQGETLSAIAQTMGYSAELMRAANPDLSAEEAIDQGTVVALPRLYVVTQDTLLSATADRLQTSDEALISANPALAEQPEIRAGAVLVVPPQQEEQP